MEMYKEVRRPVPQPPATLTSNTAIAQYQNEHMDVVSVRRALQISPVKHVPIWG